jgi:hypothetical protein
MIDKSFIISIRNEAIKKVQKEGIKDPNYIFQTLQIEPALKTLEKLFEEDMIRHNFSYESVKFLIPQILLYFNERNHNIKIPNAIAIALYLSDERASAQWISELLGLHPLTIGINTRWIFCSSVFRAVKGTGTRVNKENHEIEHYDILETISDVRMKLRSLFKAEQDKSFRQRIEREFERGNSIIQIGLITNFLGDFKLALKERKSDIELFGRYYQVKDISYRLLPEFLNVNTVEIFLGSSKYYRMLMSIYSKPLSVRSSILSRTAAFIRIIEGLEEDTITIYNSLFNKNRFQPPPNFPSP